MPSTAQRSSTVRPRLVVHADWSTDAAKRWMAVAEWTPPVGFQLARPVPVGDAATLVERMLRRANGGGVFLGFDFPIGLPSAYARHAGIVNFPAALKEFGHGRWSRFYQVASHPTEISLERPFYPSRPGGTTQMQLASALGESTLAQFRRQCEMPTETRGAACVLFWTLGGNQVGRAAISGWQTVVAPAVRAGVARLWPFDGPLLALLSESDCVIAETYPAQACVQLGLRPPGRGWSKRNQADRQARARELFRWTQGRPVELSADLKTALEDGFGATSIGEDVFDATVGLLAMLDVAMALAPDGCPDVAAVRTVEGWILGQAANGRPQ